MEMAISQIETLHRSLLPLQLQSTRRITQQEELHRRCRFLPTNCSSSSSAHRLPRLQHRVVPSEPVVERLHPLHDVVGSCEDGLDSYGLLTKTFNKFTKLIESYRLTADREDFFANVTEIYERFHDMGSQYNLLKGILTEAFTLQMQKSKLLETKLLFTEEKMRRKEQILSDLNYRSFADMGLRKKLLMGLYYCGFKTPYDTQQKGIVPFCKGLNVIQQANPGSGKTTTFCSGILQQLDYGNVECQALVLVPKRELTEQIEKVMQTLGYFLGVKVYACVGGTSAGEDQPTLLSSAHVVVGTPNHVLDMLQRESLRPDYIKMFVLDEADVMLSLGFKDQIHDIFGLLPKEVQVGVFSARMHLEQFFDISSLFKNKPVQIIFFRDLEDIKQIYVNVEKEEFKFETLCDLYKTPATTQSVIFVNTNHKVDWLADKMRGCGHVVSAVHRDMDESSGYTSMNEFVNGSSRVLITTDQLALSVDVLQVPIIINYDLPAQHEEYSLRITGIGPDGGTGIAINFVTEDDKSTLPYIQKAYDVVVEELPRNPNVADLLR